MRRLIGLILLLIVIVALLAWGLRPRPVPVDIAEVTRAPLSLTLEQEGKTWLRDRYQISAPVAGMLARIDLEPGDAVRAGQTLAIVAPAPPTPLDARGHAEAKAGIQAADAAIQAARAGVDAARSDLRLAEQELTRARGVHERNPALVSRQELERLEAALGGARARLDSARFHEQLARHEKALAEARLAEHDPGAGGRPLIVTSPVDGVILQRHRDSAGPVQPGEALLEIGDPASLEVRVDVITPDAVRLRPGTPVRLERWGGDAALDGRVRRVEPGGFTKVSALGVEEQRTWVIVELLDPPPEVGLGDGFRVEAVFELWAEDNITQLPAGSLFRHQGHWHVFAVRDGIAYRQPVEIGQHAGRQAQVLDGLSPGDRIVAFPDDRLQHGSRVEPRHPE